MTALYVGLAVLAVYRISYLITSEDGPFDFASRFRALLVDPVTRLPRWQSAEWLTRGVHCTLCVSFWLALIPALYFERLWSLSPVDVFMLWLGIAGGVVVIAKVAR